MTVFKSKEITSMLPKGRTLKTQNQSRKGPTHPTSKVHIHHNSVHTVLSPHHTCPENMPAPLVMYRRKSEILERGERNSCFSDELFKIDTGYQAKMSCFSMYQYAPKTQSKSLLLCLLFKLSTPFLSISIK